IGGTLSLPDNADNVQYYEDDVDSDGNAVTEGGVQSFSMDGDEYNATFSEGNFSGYQNSKANTYTGQQVFENLPFYYSLDKYKSGDLIIWPINTGDVCLNTTKYERDETTTRLVQANVGVLGAYVSRGLGVTDRA